MAELNIAANAPPIWLTKNFFNRFSAENSGITVSTGEAFKERPIDFVRETKWTSVGSSDGSPETYAGKLFESTAQTVRSVDFIALLGINLKNFIFQYSDDNGATFTTLPELNFPATSPVADFSGTDKLVTLASPVDIDLFQIIATDVQAGTGTEKEISEIILATANFQPSKGFVKYEKAYEDQVKTVKLADGSIDSTNLFRGDAGFDFYRSSMSFMGVSQAQRELFLARKRDTDPFVIFPEPGNVPADAFFCRFRPSSFKEKYISMHRAAGYEIKFDLEELGKA